MTTKTKATARPGPAAAVEPPASLLTELRELAATAPARARSDCWTYLRDAGSGDERDLLAALFAQGTVPQLHGDYEGMIVASCSAYRKSPCSIRLWRCNPAGSARASTPGPGPDTIA